MARNTRKVPNETSVRWVRQGKGKDGQAVLPYVVERKEQCVEYYQRGRLLRTSFIKKVVGRFATEKEADQAAVESARKAGGFVFCFGSSVRLFVVKKKRTP